MSTQPAIETAVNQTLTIAAVKERNELKTQRDFYLQELLSISKTYCDCDFTDSEQVEGGFTEGLVYAFLEGAFDARCVSIAQKALSTPTEEGK